MYFINGGIDEYECFYFMFHLVFLFEGVLEICSERQDRFHLGGASGFSALKGFAYHGAEPRARCAADLHLRLKSLSVGFRKRNGME